MQMPEALRTIAQIISDGFFYSYVAAHVLTSDTPDNKSTCILRHKVAALADTRCKNVLVSCLQLEQVVISCWSKPSLKHCYFSCCAYEHMRAALPELT